MFERQDFYDRPSVYSRAEPDDEYDNPKSEPLDPNFNENDEKDVTEEDDEDELDEEEI